MLGFPQKIKTTTNKRELNKFKHIYHFFLVLNLEYKTKKQKTKRSRGSSNNLNLTLKLNKALGIKLKIDKLKYIGLKLYFYNIYNL